jgi:ribonuclease P protein component
VERRRRLRRGREFDTAFADGSVTGGPLVAVRCRRNEAGVTRWGFAVGKRLAKNAVDRNRLRRRLREAARALDVAEGYDMVVVARAGSLEASFAVLRQALEGRLRRVGVLRDDGERG